MAACSARCAYPFWIVAGVTFLSGCAALGQPERSHVDPVPAASGGGVVVGPAPQALHAGAGAVPLSSSAAAPTIQRTAFQEQRLGGRVPVSEVLPMPNADGNVSQASVEPFLIDLPTALRLANAENPQIRFASERIAVAQAQYEQASVLWLPHLSVGPRWLRHDGQIQDIRGEVITVSRSALFAGGGARLQVGVADAYFEPLAARQMVAASSAGQRAVTNETLLEVALAYWDLVRAHAALAIARETLDNTSRLDERAQGWLRIEKLKPADAERVRTELHGRAQDLQLAQEKIRVVSARLARLLRLDPFLTLVPGEGRVVPLDLVDPQLPPAELAATALGNRPELAESRALAQAAGARLRQAEMGPFLPSFVLDYAAGGFGGGRNSFFGEFDGRSDAEVAAVWQLHNLGLGNRALARQRAAEMRQSQIHVMAEMDRVVSEAAQAAARVQARRQQLPPADSAVASAASSFKRNFELFSKGGVELILPIEVLQSLNAMNKARQDQLEATIAYNHAQLQLHWALGFPVDASPVNSVHE
jgi:outer membrane protein TolC